MPIKKLKQKGKRLVDVLDERKKNKFYWIIDKLLKLQARITSHNPRLDDSDGDDIRWVDRVLEECEEGYIPDKKELEKANQLWRKWS